MISPTFLRGVQAGHGILENHLHLGAQLLVLLVCQIAGNVHPVEQDLPGGGLIQTDHAAADGAFAAAALPHQTVGFAGINHKIHPVHRLYGELAAALEILLEALDLQKGLPFFHISSPPSSYAGYGHAAPWAISTLGARSSSSQVAA